MTDTLIDASNEAMVEAYLSHIEHDAGLSVRSVRTYTETLQNYLKWLDGRPVSTVRPRDVQDFGRRVRPRVEKPSANTVRRDVVVVRLFHTWCNENDFDVRTVTTAVAPKVPKPHPKPIEDDVWRALWGSQLDDQDRLWLGLGYFVGLRRAEIVTIRPSEVQPQRGLLDFLRKGGSYFPVEYLDCLTAVDEELPFLTMGRANQFLEILHTTAESRAKMGANFLWYDSVGHDENDGNRLNKRLDKRLIPQLGLPPHSVTPHRLRHSAATNLCRAGCLPAFVKVQLSHSSISITERYMEMSGQMARHRLKEKIMMGRDRDG